MNKRRDILWRIYLAFFLVCVFGFAIVSKSFKTQVVEGAYWRNLADSLTIFYKSIEAERGNVFSNEGDLLATSVPVFEIRMDFASEAMTNEIFNAHVDSLSICMAHKFGQKPALEYKKALVRNRLKGNRYYLIKRRATYPELQEIKRWPLFRLGRYKSGMIITQKHERKMPFGILAQRTIGYVRDDGRYKVGIEGRYDNDLTGVRGQMLVQKISGGTLVPLDEKGEISARPGKDIYTTLDINLQDVAQSALLRSLEKNRADHGSVILMEVKTGKIKAISNLGKNDDGWYEEKYNYAVGESTEPGSTFKLATMIALLEDEKVKVTDSVDLENGRKKFFDRTMRDAKPHKRRNETIKKSFELSSNVAMSSLIYEHYKDSPEKFYNHLVKLGLNQPVGIEIIGEPVPTINKPQKWSGVSLPWMSVGYEVSLTPLQLLTFYNAIANDGQVVKPYLVDQIKNYNRVVMQRKPVILKEQICSQKTLDLVHDLLVGVVEEGTAKNIRSDNYKIAGKTGTARIANGKTGYRDRVYQSSFVGYFPAENPMYSCIVVVNAPTAGVFYGSYVAAPVFKEIADKVYANGIEMHEVVNQEGRYAKTVMPEKRSGYRDDFETIYNALGISAHGAVESEWITCQSQDQSMSLRPRTVEAGRVPEVRGMGLKDAIYLLENHGLKVKCQGAGKVYWQSLRYGQIFNQGQTIELKLG